jgi:curved DNA-binding protein CbpA
VSAFNLPDYYSQLGVSPLASPDEVKSSWRAAAFALHPDRNPGSDGAAFRAAAEAWEFLGDAGRRERYDTMRAMEATFGGQGFGGQGPRAGTGRAGSGRTGWSPGWSPPPSARPQEPGLVRADPRVRDAWENRARRERDAAHERFRAEQRTAQHHAYEAEQQDLESLLHVLGHWTRTGTMRTGELGRRSRAIGLKDRRRVLLGLLGDED